MGRPEPSPKAPKPFFKVAPPILTSISLSGWSGWLTWCGCHEGAPSPLKVSNFFCPGPVENSLGVYRESKARSLRCPLTEWRNGRAPPDYAWNDWQLGGRADGTHLRHLGHVGKEDHQ
eukprot:257781-Prorocentrum_minimum.AAC.1